MKLSGELSSAARARGALSAEYLAQKEGEERAEREKKMATIAGLLEEMTPLLKTKKEQWGEHHRGASLQDSWPKHSEAEVSLHEVKDGKKIFHVKIGVDFYEWDRAENQKKFLDKGYIVSEGDKNVYLNTAVSRAEITYKLEVAPEGDNIDLEVGEVKCSTVYRGSQYDSEKYDFFMTIAMPLDDIADVLRQLVDAWWRNIPDDVQLEEDELERQ
ncbi:MAG: hypothetical protein UU36_C0050G0003 [Candidatus Uhrbacteria bacterium GW2011_GWE2_41_1153]|nr:MAG: hypothetical protein UU36_C0050G0003 [Candidatus Uhrbacteria bacterium GW2011_GWE2_41_1153]